MQFFLLLLSCGFLNAGETVGKRVDQMDSAMAKNAEGWKEMVCVVPGAGRNGGDVLEIDVLRVRIMSSNLIPVDINKSYKLEGWFRSVISEKPASAYFGLIMYDKDKRPIYLSNVLCFPALTAVLLEDVSAGQDTLVVSNTDGWESVKSGAIAFGAKQDLSDLPNFTTDAQYESFEKESDQKGVIVKLKKPLSASYPAGTNLRVHSPWSAPLYRVADEWIPFTWKKYETTLNGEALAEAPNNKFWRGTRYVQIFFELGNWDRIPEKGAKLQGENIFLTELTNVSR